MELAERKGKGRKRAGRNGAGKRSGGVNILT